MCAQPHLYLLHCFSFQLPFHHNAFYKPSLGCVLRKHVQAVTQALASMNARA